MESLSQKFILVTKEEMESQKKEILSEFLVQLTGNQNPLNLGYWGEMLTRKEAAKDLGISQSTISRWAKVKVHPLPLVGTPERISRMSLRKWHKKYSSLHTQGV